MNVRVLIADDHEVVRQGLRVFLGIDPEITVVGEARNGSQAVQLARELRPDVVLMDLLMPVMDGLAATAAIRRELPETAVLMLTAVIDQSVAWSATVAGAAGCVQKDVSPIDLRSRIKALIAPRLASGTRFPSQAGSAPNPRLLTEREESVLRLLVRGCSNKEICRTLNISEPTVKTHISHLMAKLGVSSRTQAALYAVQAGWIQGEALHLEPSMAA